MDARQRVLLGAVGGITPYLITLLSLDFKSVVGGYEILDWIGLAVRCLVLIFLGSLVAWLHKTESEPFKVFQLGLAAPALLAAFINGNAGTSQPMPTLSQPVASYSFSLISSAHADDDDNYVNAGLLREPRVSGFARFLRGALGARVETADKAAWFVIVGSHKHRKNAEKQAERLEQQHYEAHVYKPYGGSAHYAVVIASHVTQQEARTIRDRAIRDGLPKDSYVWRY